MSHTPVCQYKGCNKEANDYDRRFGRNIFFCNTVSSFHDPRSGYSSNSFTKSVKLICEGCGTTFSATIEEETTEEFKCSGCGHSAPVRVGH